MNRLPQIPLLALLLALPSAAVADISRVLAAIEEHTRWEPSGAPVLSNAKEPAEERQPNAVIFLEYGFSERERVRLLGPKERSLILDVYEMVDSAAAYGIFTYLRPATAMPVKGIGNAGIETTSGIAFQQDRYYVALSAPGPLAPLRQPVLQIAAAISKALPMSSFVPMVADKLPKEKRVPGSEKFLMGPEAFSRVLPLASKDPFGIATGAEAALARYESSNETATLLLIYYPTQQLARKFLNAGYKDYCTRYPRQPVFYKRDGPLAVIVLDSSSPELAMTLLEGVSYVSTVSWDPKVEPPSIAQVMLNIFMFCGVMLAITFATGFVFGILRVLINRLFPGKVFDKPKNMKVIQLNLDSRK